MLEDLQECRYLIVRYGEASDHWDAFRASADTERLDAALASLHRAWLVVRDDEALWSGLGAVFHQSDLAAGMEEYADTDRLLAHEPLVLVGAEMTPVHAVRVLTDLSQTLGRRVEPLRPEQYEELRSLSARLAEALGTSRNQLSGAGLDPVAELARQRVPHRLWRRILNIGGKALVATGGLASAVGNVVALVQSVGLATGLATGSVVGGAEAAWKALHGLDESGDLPPARCCKAPTATGPVPSA